MMHAFICSWLKEQLMSGQVRRNWLRLADVSGAVASEFS